MRDPRHSKGFFRSPRIMGRANGLTKCGRYLLASSLTAPCLGQGVSRRARVGWVRSLVFLSILNLF